MRNSSALCRPVQAGPAGVRPFPRLAVGRDRGPGMNTHRKESDPKPDERLATFKRWLDSIDRHDWKAGLSATRDLRSLGLSCVLIPKPSGDRRGA